jgi:putative ABC transport system permease protein
VPSVDLGRPIPEAWQSLVAVPEVERFEPYMEGFAYWDKPNGGMELVLVIGTRLGPDSMGAIDALTPELRTRLSEPYSIVVDRGEFDRLGIQKVGDTAEIFGKRVRVVGTVAGFRSLAGPYLFCSLFTASKLLRLPHDQCTFILAKCHDKSEAPKVVERLKQEYPKKLYPFTKEDFSLHSRMHWLTKTKAGIALGLAAALGLLVGAVVTSQTLYSATVASLKEYAVLRALGIPRWRMAMMVILQSFWVGVAGVALALPAIFGISYAGDEIGAKILLPPELLVGSVVITMTMAMLSGFLALRSLRLIEPVTLLR